MLKAEQAKEREAEQSKGRKMQTAISFGATILGAFTGSKKLSTGTLGRATTTMRDVGRSIDESGDVKRAEETVAAVKQKLADLETELQAEIDALEAKIDPQAETLEKVLMRPRKSDITVDALGLVWMPYWQDATGVADGRLGIEQRSETVTRREGEVQDAEGLQGVHRQGQSAPAGRGLHHGRHVRRGGRPRW